VQEYRETTLNAAVDALYSEMASRHRVRSPCIQVCGVSWVCVSEWVEGSQENQAQLVEHHGRPRHTRS